MFKFHLLENEKVLSLYRQSEAVLFKPVLIVFVLIYFPWYFLVKYELVAAYDRLLFFWTVLVALYALSKYLLWLLNVYIVTDKRLIRVRYANLLNKHVLETRLEQIQNVSFSVHGFWQSLFRFGAVEVRTMGLGEPLVLKNVSHPAEIKDFIWRVRNVGTK